MSENLNACKALAAMVREHGKPNIEEVNFIAHAALQLGLDNEQNQEVHAVLENGGDFNKFISEVKDRDTRIFVFRRIVEVSLMDDQINAEERQYITTAAEEFGYEEGVVVAFVSWMREGMEWERRGAEIIEHM